MIKAAHDVGALVLVDAAQLIAHHQVDVRELDCDFLSFSGHKLYGPFGIGVLYGKRELLEAMPPFLGGGMMINEVTTEKFTPAEIPAKFEAGTPSISQAVGLAAAIDWLTQFSWPDIEEYEHNLLKLTEEKLSILDDLELLGIRDTRYEIRDTTSGCISFTHPQIHAHDLTEILGRQGICLRAGHHCCQPLHDYLGIKASTRVSVGIYNQESEIDNLIPAIEKAIKLMSD